MPWEHLASLLDHLQLSTWPTELPWPTESHHKVLTLWNAKSQQYLEPVEQGFHSLEIVCEIWQQHFPSDSNHEIFDILYNCYP